MTTAEQKKKLKEFYENWQGRGYELGETALFWNQLLRAIDYKHRDTLVFNTHLKSGGYPDVWLREVDVMIEQKSLNVDLDKPEPRQGEMKTPFKQVLDYAEDLPLSEQPSFLITCNFGTFRVYDRTKWSKSELEQHPFEFSLEELSKHPEYLSCITSPENTRLEKETAVSIQAGERIGKLYDMLRKGYLEPDSEKNMHALNVLCVRLVFCLYCEDAGIFEKDSFYNYLKEVPEEDVRMKLKALFKMLDTEKENRDPYDNCSKLFPYVNGGLFDEEIEIPNFTKEAKEYLLNEVSAPVDWSQISPTVFGGIFESTLNPKTRRAGGMHFTPVDDIHKVIDPLFMNDLWEEFRAITNDDDLTPLKKDNRLKKLHSKICKLTFFDPACGSGNFLTETYLCLRKLEDAILGNMRMVTRKFGDNSYEYMPGQIGMTDSSAADSSERISLSQFYGIEINDFAVSVAETALYISRLKANADTMMLLDIESGDLPLQEKASIFHGNSLAMDWNSFLPAENCDYVISNPPFVGKKYQTPEQKADMARIFKGKIKGYGVLDYVSCWYMKFCAEYLSINNQLKAAFVSTSSLIQGEQAVVMWPDLFSTYNTSISFAYQPFEWDGENATVMVVILGIEAKRKSIKYLFSKESIIETDIINIYLFPGVSAQLSKRTKSINAPIECVYGSFALDDGNYTIEEEEFEKLVNHNPENKRFLPLYLGSEEIINNKKRYCVWVTDETLSDALKLPDIKEKIDNVREWRSSRERPRTKKAARTPHLFAEDRQPKSSYLAIPITSSERRDYIPITFLEASVIGSNHLIMIPNADNYIFGVLTSQMHNAWMRIVAGRRDDRYNYSSQIVYNNFIWPNPSDEQKKQIETCAQAVLDIRETYPGAPLATLYDPSTMPKELLDAHKALDLAVEQAYGMSFNGDEERMVSHLFELYQNY